MRVGQSATDPDQFDKKVDHIGRRQFFRTNPLPFLPESPQQPTRAQLAHFPGRSDFQLLLLPRQMAPKVLYRRGQLGCLRGRPHIA